MILFNDYEKKLVIPKWLTYGKAVRSGELTWPKKNASDLADSEKKRFQEDYINFKASPTPHAAADLMGTAFVLSEMPLAKELAAYIKANSTLSKPAIDLAKHILGDEAEKTAPSTNYQKIALARKFLKQFPHNPFGWIGCARIYTIIGETDKAEKCVRIAYNLAPADRYIARSTARFFLHIDKYDEAWHYIKKSSAIQFDPWIKATEISVSQVVDKEVRKLKGLLPLNSSPDQAYHFSEFIESYGMLEFINGNEHRAKKFFKQAWSNPSSNVVTHSEWIVREHFPALKDIVKNNFGGSLEAITWQNYHNLNLENAITTSIEWSLEEPYAKNAFALGSSMCFKSFDYPAGIKIAKNGLVASPNEFVLQNNICFGLLKLNKPDEAEIAFAKIATAKNPRDHVVHTATNGLLEFKKGNIDLGRSLYIQAAGEAKELGDLTLLTSALLNWATAEAENNSSETKVIAEAALKFSEKQKIPEIYFTRRVLEMRLTEFQKKQEALPFKEFHQFTIPPSLLT